MRWQVQIRDVCHSGFGVLSTLRYALRHVRPSVESGLVWLRGERKGSALPACQPAACLPASLDARRRDAQRRRRSRSSAESHEVRRETTVAHYPPEGELGLYFEPVTLDSRTKVHPCICLFHEWFTFHEFAKSLIFKVVSDSVIGQRFSMDACKGRVKSDIKSQSNLMNFEIIVFRTGFIKLFIAKEYTSKGDSAVVLLYL